MMWGLKIKAKSDGNESVYWFDSMESRDQYIKRFSKDHYVIVEYIADQLELPFDVR